jgi:HK97 family phage major capsid protein
MAKKLQDLLTEIKAKSDQVNALFNVADERGDGANTKDEIESIKTLNKEIEELEKEAGDLKEMDEIRTANGNRTKAAKTPVNAVPFQGGERQDYAYKSLGEELLDDPAFKTWLQSVAGDGRVPSSAAQIQSPRIPLKGFFGNSIKTLVTGASGWSAPTSTSGGALVPIDRKPIVDFSYARPLNVRDIITIGQTNSDTVEFARETSVTNAAAPTAEATATADGTGAKPESAMAFEAVTAPVRTIPHWLPVTNQALADAAQLRTYIDNFLRYGIEEEVEDQIIAGSGSGQNFGGVLNASGTTAQSFSTDILTTTRKARTKVRVTGRAMATAFVMHPNDWETIDLLQDNEARYFYGGPAQMGNPRLWGLPVIESEAMTEGYTVCADWRLAILWERMQTVISMSNSHSDFFVRNLVAVLAEYRAAFALIRPKAFVVTDIAA